MGTQKFKTKVLKNEKGQVYIETPFNPTEVFGKSVRHYISGKINGIKYSGSLGIKNGAFRFPINKELQLKMNIEPEQLIEVEMFAAKAESLEMPEDLKLALERNKKAFDFFKSITSFYQNTYIKWITSAKQEETRNKRVIETIALLMVEKKQK